MPGLHERQTFVYIGSFFAGEARGIRVFRWDESGGAMELAGVATDGVENPLYLETDPRQRVLYVADCLESWEQGGAVSAHAIDPATGMLTYLNRQDSGGVIPVNLAVLEHGGFVGVTNCGPFALGSDGRTVAVLPAQVDGRLGEATSVRQHEGSSVDPDRQASPHPHSIALAPDNRHAIVPDLGTDRVVVYQFDAASGTLEENAPPFVQTQAGSGPRYLKFHPNGRFAYLITEIANTVVAYAYDPDAGTLTELQTVSTLPEGHAGDGSAANEHSNKVVSYRIDEETGRLAPTGNVIEVPRPACIKFARPSG